MTSNSLAQGLNQLLLEADPRAMAGFELETALAKNEKFPLDSLALFEFATLIEEKYGVQIRDEELSLIAFPASLLELVASRL